jgi:phosphoesterase RecJ-like protein
VKVSMRSAGLVNVRELAMRFGGGGHRVAAGAQQTGSMEAVRERVVTALEEAIGEARSTGALTSSEERERK